MKLHIRNNNGDWHVIHTWGGIVKRTPDNFSKFKGKTVKELMKAVFHYNFHWRVTE